MLSEIVARVERRLEALGIKAAPASKKAGLTEDAIRNMKRAAKEGTGRQGVSTRTLTALAPVLETSVEWLLNGDGDEHQPPVEGVPVVGYVQAGSESVAYETGQGNFDIVSPPAGATNKTVALAVRGNSLGPAFHESLVFYDEVRAPVTPDLHGKLCVVGLLDGRVLVKIVRAAGDGTYHLFSNTMEEPLLNEEVAWAAKVNDIRPR